MTDEYRAKAEYCRQMADQVLSPFDKEMWLQLAWDWSTLASVPIRYTVPGASVGAVDAGATLTLDRPDQRNGRVPSAFSYYWSGECGAPLEKQMTILKSVMVAAVLLAGGISLAIAQNGPATGGERPVAGGANGGGPAYGQVYRYGYRYGPRHLYAYSPYHRRYRHWRYY